MNFSYIDNESFEEKYVSVPEQGAGTLIPEGMPNPGQVYTVGRGKSGMIGVFRLESQMLPGNGKFERSGLGSDMKCKEATNTAFNYLKANANRISGSISTTMKDYIINYQDLQGIGMTEQLALPTLCFNGSFFITLFYTGMRLGEIQALTWKDFKNGELQIVKSLTRKAQGKSYAIKEPKSTSSIRNIQVGKNLELYLNKYKEKQSKLAGFNEDWFMFGNLKPLAKTTITREKDKAIKEAGVKRISIHDFRHSHASNLIANGINIVAVSKRLGHSSVEMTLRVYTHLIKTTEDQLLSYIDESSQNLLTK